MLGTLQIFPNATKAYAHESETVCPQGFNVDSSKYNGFFTIRGDNFLPVAPTKRLCLGTRPHDSPDGSRLRSSKPSASHYGNSRIALRAPSEDPIFAGFKQAAFSLYYGDAPIFHFDLEGRWQRAFVEGIHYLKGLDTTVQAIDRVREGENLVLEAADAAALLEASATSTRW